MKPCMAQNVSTLPLAFLSGVYLPLGDIQFGRSLWISGEPQFNADGEMASEMRIVFGKRVRELREKAGFSQGPFADRCGLDRSYLSGLERGKHSPSIDVALVIAYGLGVTMSRLFEDFERYVKRPQLWERKPLRPSRE